MSVVTAAPGHMSGTEPAVPFSPQRADGRARSATWPDLRRTCALPRLPSSAPAVLVTPSADEYVRVVRQVSLRGPDYLATRLLAALFLPCFMLAGLVLVFIEGDPEKLASASAETWVVLLLFFSAGMMLWSTVHGHDFLREGLPFRVPAGVESAWNTDP